MDVEVIDVEDGNTDSNEGGEANAPLQDENPIVLEPRIGMEFNSEESAKKFYENYIKRLGFSTRVGQSKDDGTASLREYICSRNGSRISGSESCRAMLGIELKGENEWVVAKFIKEHSHSNTSTNKLQYLRPHRTNNVAETYQRVDKNRVTAESNHTVQKIGSVGYANAPRNNHPVKKRTLGRDAQNLLEYFKKMQAENPGFYYAIQLDEENRMSNAFWADSRSRTAYSHFGDAVTFDTMYRSNQYKVPFTPFTGLNHHGQTILFGCALVLDESEATFVWLFKTFLAAMNDRAPFSVTTENYRVLEAAVSHVFPDARHCVSKWHVLREGQERMARVCLEHPNFQVELYNCLNSTVTVDEFESFWESIIEKYDLKRNNWLQSLYEVRTHWVPVYFRDSFFGNVFPCPGYQTSFFDGYVNQQTTLPIFFRQYERALEDSFEREIEADFDTTCTTPTLKTPSPMEKQAANLYTKRIFLKFQEELVETFVYTANRIDGDKDNPRFRVVKFEDDNKAYYVSLNVAEVRANCSCRMFEYSGILCRHVLTVFTVTNVLTLPPHYILKRWTRNAKSGVASDEIQGRESLTKRYNYLCKEAIRFCEEGAISLETCGAALSSLREGEKKVAGVKKNVTKVAPRNSNTTGVSSDDWRAYGSIQEMTPLLWPRQEETPRHFNLNDSGNPGRPNSSSSVPWMAPVSIHRDDGQNENMASALPCLKSMTWVMENKHLKPANRVAVINLKLQDFSRIPPGESEIKFSLSRVTLEPMLKSMAHISEQLSTPANKVAVINLKLQDAETASGESEIKFQVSKDTLGAMLRSMAYIREQLSNAIDAKQDNAAKRQRK